MNTSSTKSSLFTMLAGIIFGLLFLDRKLFFICTRLLYLMVLQTTGGSDYVVQEFSLVFQMECFLAPSLLLFLIKKLHWDMFCIQWIARILNVQFDEFCQSIHIWNYHYNQDMEDLHPTLKLPYTTAIHPFFHTSSPCA